MMSPNTWSVDRQQLERPITLESTSARVAISQEAPGNDVVVQLPPWLDDAAERDSISRQVRRMLRLEGWQETMDAFQAVVPGSGGFHPTFRSPRLWEDLVKTLLLCNCGWSRSLLMAEALVREVGSGERFPEPGDFGAWSEPELRQRTGVGYRAKSLLRLAQGCRDGSIDLAWFESAAVEGRDPEEVFRRALELPGVGPYGAANVCQLLGIYRFVPADTETVRHLKHAHGVSCDLRSVRQRAQQHYASAAPFQFLAYWRELWEGYESLAGPIRLLDPALYKIFTGANMTKGRNGQFAATPSRKRGRRDVREAGPATPAVAVELAANGKPAGRRRLRVL